MFVTLLVMKLVKSKETSNHTPSIFDILAKILDLILNNWSCECTRTQVTPIHVTLFSACIAKATLVNVCKFDEGDISTITVQADTDSPNDDTI